MLKFIVRSLLPMFIGVMFLTPVSYAMEHGIHAVQENQRTPLATYVSAKKTFIGQEADDKVDWISNSFHYAHPTSWDPEHLFQENPLTGHITQEIQTSFESYCKDKDINVANAQPLLTCFLERYKQAFEKFDATFNEIRSLMIKNKQSLHGKIASDGVNQALKDEYLRTVGALDNTLKEQLQTIKNIEKFTPEQLLACAQGK